MVETRLLIVSASSGIAVYALTVTVSIATDNPPDLFHANSTSGLVDRAPVITAIILATVPLAVRVASVLATMALRRNNFIQLVEVAPPKSSPPWATLWLLPPIQGIDLCSSPWRAS
jgi:hypothetical protein